MRSGGQGRKLRSRAVMFCRDGSFDTIFRMWSRKIEILHNIIIYTINWIKRIHSKRIIRATTQQGCKCYIIMRDGARRWDCAAKIGNDDIYRISFISTCSLDLYIKHHKYFDYTLWRFSNIPSLWTLCEGLLDYQASKCVIVSFGLFCHSETQNSKVGVRAPQIHKSHKSEYTWESFWLWFH